jgi:hypothetical protein
VNSAFGDVSFTAAFIHVLIILPVTGRRRTRACSTRVSTNCSAAGNCAPGPLEPEKTTRPTFPAPFAPAFLRALASNTCNRCFQRVTKLGSIPAMSATLACSPRFSPICSLNVPTSSTMRSLNEAVYLLRTSEPRFRLIFAASSFSSRLASDSRWDRMQESPRG